MRLLTTIVAAALVFPGAASANGGAAALIKDCQDEKVDGSYTAAEYRQALQRLPTDVDEYTNCRATLRSAQLRAAALPRATSSSGADTPAQGAVATPATPAPPAGSGSASGSIAGVPAPSTTPAPVPAPAPTAAAPAAGLPPGTVRLAASTGAGQEVPPILAIVLVCLAAGALGASAIVRRQRRRT